MPAAGADGMTVSADGTQDALGAGERPSELEQARGARDSSVLKVLASSDHELSPIGGRVGLGRTAVVSPTNTGEWTVLRPPEDELSG